MTPAASQQVVHSAFHLFQAVSNLGETDKPLIGMMKLPAVSLFHDFGRTPSAKFNRIGRRFENSQWASPENGETAKRTEINQTISRAVCFSGLKRPETPLGAQDG